LATYSAPIAPLAPGRFSTKTLCPSELLSRSDKSRATKSVVPPAVKATTSRIGREGKSCACAAPNGTPDTASAAAISAPRQ
jgi:hypothetical protein